MATGRVVRIFDSRRIAIDLGEEAGVVEGDRFDIYTPETDVRDPDSGEVLGMYRQRKATVYAREIFPRFCVAYPRDRRVPVPGNTESTSVFGNIFLSKQYRTEPGHAPVEESEIEGVPTGTRVRVGDTAEMIPKEARPAEDSGQSTSEASS